MVNPYWRQNFCAKSEYVVYLHLHFQQFPKNRKKSRFWRAARFWSWCLSAGFWRLSALRDSLPGKMLPRFFSTLLYHLSTSLLLNSIKLHNIQKFPHLCHYSSAGTWKNCFPFIPFHLKNILQKALRENLHLFNHCHDFVIYFCCLV